MQLLIYTRISASYLWKGKWFEFSNANYWETMRIREKRKLYLESSWHELFDEQMQYQKGKGWASADPRSDC